MTGAGLEATASTQAALPAEEVRQPARSPSRFLGRAGRAALLALVAFLFLAQGIGAPVIKDQETQSPQWILDVIRGHWLIPHDYYGLTMRKPPLYYWLSALVVEAAAGRINRYTLRVVPLASAVGLALEVALWTIAYVGEAEGWLAFFFLLGLSAFAARATVVLMDMLFTFLFFSAYIALYPALSGNPSRLRALGAGAVLGLAVLAKGPLAIALGALGAVIFLLWDGQNPLGTLARPWPWRALLAALLVAGVWYAPALVYGGREMVAIVIDENLGHFLSVGMGGTGEAARPFYYVAVKTIGGGLPLSLLVPALVVALCSDGSSASRRRALRFQAGLVLAALLVFSAAAAKRDDYVLPVMPGLAILLASLFGSALSRESLAGRTRDVTVAGLAVAILVLVGALFALPWSGLARAVSPRLSSADAFYLKLLIEGVADMHTRVVLCLGTAALGALAILAANARRRTMLAGAGLALISLGGVSLFTGALRPGLARARCLDRFAAAIHRRVGDAPVYVLARDWELSYYYGRGVMPLARRPRPWSADEGMVYVVAAPPALQRLAPQYRSRLKFVMASGVKGDPDPPALFELVAPPDGQHEGEGEPGGAGAGQSPDGKRAAKS